MARCAIGFCSSQRHQHKLHGFPKDEVLQKKWMLACRRADPFSAKSSFVCSKHFDDSDYERDLPCELLKLPPRKKLKRCAVPHLLLPNAIVSRTFDHWGERISELKKRAEKQDLCYQTIRHLTTSLSSTATTNSSNHSVERLSRRLNPRCEFENEQMDTPQAEEVIKVPPDHKSEEIFVNFEEVLVQSEIAEPSSGDCEVVKHEIESEDPLRCNDPLIRESMNQIDDPLVNVETSCTLEQVFIKIEPVDHSAEDYETSSLKILNYGSLSSNCHPEKQLSHLDMIIKQEPVDDADELLQNTSTAEECSHMGSKEELVGLTKSGTSSKEKRSKKVKWSDDDIIRAFNLRSLGTQSYSRLRKNKKIRLPGKLGFKRWAKSTSFRNGILHNVIKLMAFCSNDLSKEEKVIVLVVDEIIFSETIEYDEIGDEIIGPHDKMQMVMAQSLVGSWIQPVFVSFDTAITKTTILDIISTLFTAGFTVVCCVGDCSRESFQLWDTLGISSGIVSFPHPTTQEPIACICDASSIIVAIRDQILSKGFLSKGYVINRDPLDAIIRLVNMNLNLRDELDLKLDEIHLMKTTRNSTLFAKELLSNSVAKAISIYSLGKTKTHTNRVSKFFSTISCWFDMMNVHSSESSSAENDNPLNKPYGLFLKDQNKILDTVWSMAKCIDVPGVNAPPFRAGLMLSCSALPLILENSLRYGIESIPTRSLSGDWLKNVFISMTVDGQLLTPMEALERLRELMFERIPYHRNDWDPESLPRFLFSSAIRKALLNPKEILPQPQKSSFAVLHSTFDLLESYVKGKLGLPYNVLSFMALAVALHFKSKYKVLSKPCEEEAVCGRKMWSSGSDVVTDYFFGCVVKMERIFLNYVKRGEPLNVSGISTILSRRMKTRLKLSLPLEVIQFFVRLRLSVHVNYCMRQEMIEKKERIHMMELIKFSLHKALSKSTKV